MLKIATKVLMIGTSLYLKYVKRKNNLKKYTIFSNNYTLNIGEKEEC